MDAPDSQGGWETSEYYASRIDVPKTMLFSHYMPLFLNGWKVPHVRSFPCIQIYLHMLDAYSTHTHAVCEACLSKITKRTICGDSMVCPVCLLLVAGLLASIHSSFFRVCISRFSSIVRMPSSLPSRIFVYNAMR